MPKFDADSATCLVFTYKEGVLSPVAHDLILTVTKFSIDLDLSGGHVSARFDPMSLRVVDAAKNGEPVPGKLADKDKAEIEANIRKDVLHPDRFPDIYYLANELAPEGDGFRAAGKLHLHGHQQAMNLVSRKVGDVQRVETKIHQPDFGIKPFKAMLGALKVKPALTVRVDVPLE